MESMSVSASWEQTRRELLLELAALPSEGDVVQWQRRLADAIIASESPGIGTDKAEAKRHRHLLRVIVDGLVHQLLPEHTIRSLSRHPGPPASLSGQGVDFDFVFEQARGLRSLGFIPIIADLTTLIGVGDIVGWNGDGVVVLECKNRPVPSRQATTGRLARQRHRGEQVETYLTTSSVDEGDSVRRAYTMSMPSPDWPAVADLLNRCDDSSSGVAVYSLGHDDILVATTSQATPEQVGTLMRDSIESMSPALAFYSDLINTASFRFMAPSSYPVGGDQRWRLLEGQLRLIRVIDMSGFAAEFVHEGAVINLVPERSEGRQTLRIDIDGSEYTSFTHQLTELCLWTPTPLAAMRETLIDYARTLVTERESAAVESQDGPPLASGDKFVYATVYRPE